MDQPRWTPEYSIGLCNIDPKFLQKLQSSRTSGSRLDCEQSPSQIVFPHMTVPACWNAPACWDATFCANLAVGAAKGVEMVSGVLKAHMIQCLKSYESLLIISSKYLYVYGCRHGDQAWRWSSYNSHESIDGALWPNACHAQSPLQRTISSRGMYNSFKNSPLPPFSNPFLTINVFIRLLRLYPLFLTISDLSRLHL